MSKYTFKQFQAEYPNDAACLGKLMEINFGGTEIICPECGVQTTFHMMSARRAFACQDCGHHVYPCAGTIFHKSSTKLAVWFFAMYLMTSTRHGVAAKEIERQTGVTYKCAWRICHELRKLMAAADHRGQLGGDRKHVEIDETLLGGRIKGQGRGRHSDKKIVIFGMVERDGKIRTGTITDQTASTIEPIILEHVAEGTTISTDMHGAYTNLSDTYEHGAIDHKADEWVRGIPYQHNRGALVAVQACGERHARPHLKKARVEICVRVQLSPQHAPLTLVHVQSFGSRFRAAAFSRAVKSSR